MNPFVNTETLEFVSATYQMSSGAQISVQS